MCQPGVSGTRASTAGRPRWGLLYGLVVPQLVGLALVELGGPPSALRIALRYAVAVGTFVAMAAWVHASRAAFDLQEWCDCAGQAMTVRVIESRRPVTPAPPRPTPVVVRPTVEEEYELTRS